MWHRLILALHSMNRAYLYPMMRDGELLTGIQAYMRFRNSRIPKIKYYPLVEYNFRAVGKIIDLTDKN